MTSLIWRISNCFLLFYYIFKNFQFQLWFQSNSRIGLNVIELILLNFHLLNQWMNEWMNEKYHYTWVRYHHHHSNSNSFSLPQLELESEFELHIQLEFELELHIQLELTSIYLLLFVVQFNWITNSSIRCTCFSFLYLSVNFSVFNSLFYVLSSVECSCFQCSILFLYSFIIIIKIRTIRNSKLCRSAMVIQNIKAFCIDFHSFKHSFRLWTAEWKVLTL